MVNFFRRPKRFFKNNASTLLTFIGAGGVIVTSVLSVKATPKAMRMIDKAQSEKEEPLTKGEIVKIAAPAYIPAVAAGASTIACIFGANILNKKSQAAITSAYALLDNSFKQYRAKVEELYGEDSDIRIKEAIAKDASPKQISKTYDDLCFFYGSICMRYFENTIEAVQRAEYALNQKLLATGYASVNDLYEFLGIHKVDFGDRLGWTTYDRGRVCGCSYVEFYHHEVELEDGLVCRMIDAVTEPTFDYLDY